MQFPFIDLDAHFAQTTDAQMTDAQMTDADLLEKFVEIIAAISGTSIVIVIIRGKRSERRR